MGDCLDDAARRSPAVARGDAVDEAEEVTEVAGRVE
jgi:hypothetical protein